MGKGKKTKTKNCSGLLKITFCSYLHSSLKDLKYITMQFFEVLGINRSLWGMLVVFIIYPCSSVYKLHLNVVPRKFFEKCFKLYTISYQCLKIIIYCIIYFNISPPLTLLYIFPLVELFIIMYQFITFRAVVTLVSSWILTKQII